MDITEKRIILHGRKVIGGVAEGEALVSKMPLMGWGNADAKHGYTVERNHPLYEVPFKGKVLVFTTPRGSGGFVAYGSTRNFGTNPAAFVYREGNNLTVFAAMAANIPTVTDLDQDPTKVIETGDHVIVNGDKGTVEVIKRTMK
jgi:predicted aconitase with swiveling domain